MLNSPHAPAGSFLPTVKFISGMSARNFAWLYVAGLAIVLSGWAGGSALRPRELAHSMEVKRAQCMSMKNLMVLVEDRKELRRNAIGQPPENDPLSDEELVEADFPASVLEILGNDEQVSGGLDWPRKTFSTHVGVL